MYKIILTIIICLNITQAEEQKIIEKKPILEPLKIITKNEGTFLIHDKKSYQKKKMIAETIDYFLQLSDVEQEMYSAEIKARVLRKKLKN